MTPSPHEAPGWSRAELARALGLLGLVFAVYAPAARFGFLHYGDFDTVLQHPEVLRGLVPSTWSWAFGSVSNGTYQPLAWLSHALAVSVFGTSAAAHHLVNVGLHAANTLLVWWVLRGATGRSGLAWVVALLFGLHPLQVQTVAWVSERQGLLAAFFGLLALDRYTRFVRAHRLRDGIALHALFAASLLSKPVLLPLPLVLLLWDRWPLARGGSSLARWKEKAGLWTLAIAVGVLTLVTQLRAAGLATLDEVGSGPRLANAVVAFARTLRRLVWPDDLAAIHTFSFEFSAAEIGVSIVVLVLLGAVAWKTRTRWPFLVTGLGWWFLLQLPTVQLVQFGQESTADRFSYVPLLGLLLALVAAFAETKPSLRIGRVVALVVVLVSGAVTARELSYWRDTRTLFERNLEVTGGSAPIHLHTSAAYRDAGDTARALSHANEALRFAPDSARVNFEVAELFRELGNFVEAYNRYTRVVLIDPSFAQAYLRIGELRLARGDLEEAGRAFHRGMELAPDDVRMILGMAAVMDELGRPSDQLALLQRALVAAPETPGLRSKVAWIAMTEEVEGGPSPDAALRLAQVAWERSDRTDPLALEAMAASWAKSGRVQEARDASQRAEELARGAGREELARDIAARRDLYLH